MKPTRKVSRGSFMARIASGGGRAPGGKGAPAPAGDHDLAAPAAKGAPAGGDTDTDTA